jgi:hypothetical protein
MRQSSPECGSPARFVERRRVLSQVTPALVAEWSKWPHRSTTHSQFRRILYRAAMHAPALLSHPGLAVPFRIRDDAFVTFRGGDLHLSGGATVFSVLKRQ